MFLANLSILRAYLFLDSLVVKFSVRCFQTCKFVSYSYFLFMAALAVFSKRLKNACEYFICLRSVR